MNVKYSKTNRKRDTIHAATSHISRCKDQGDIKSQNQKTEC